VDTYARRVLGDPRAGAPIVAGPHVRAACQRHLADRVLAAHRGGHPRGLAFVPAAADVAIGFYEKVLRLPDTRDAAGDPKPFRLEPALAFIVGSLTGWIGADGYRRYREAYIEMGKGNAKTPLLAGLGLFGLTMDGETAPEVYAAAVTRDQARVMFRDAERMVDASPALAELAIVRTVNNLAAGLGFFRPFSRDQGVKSGPRPHMALIDDESRLQVSPATARGVHHQQRLRSHVHLLAAAPACGARPGRRARGRSLFRLRVCAG
jgi:phage terminase large subunit-like protein